MSLNVYLSFNGNCEEAVDFYSKVFETPKSNIMRYGDAPASEGYIPKEEEKNLVCHTWLDIMGTMVMFADMPSSEPAKFGNNITITVCTNDKEKIKALFDKMKEGGKVQMELQKTFWSEYYGMVTDKFGIPWQFSHEDKK